MDNKKYSERELMEKAIAVMQQSIPEKRADGKPTPKVGAVLVSPEGNVLATAHRGELREGDHAEYTVIERKMRDKDLTDCILFATLEPCAPGARKHPKLSCAERIINARISTVWVGIEDPDPLVDRKGIKFLQDHGVDVKIFDDDLQKIIREQNGDFLKEALNRAKSVEQEAQPVVFELDKLAKGTKYEGLSPLALEEYAKKKGLDLGSSEFTKHLVHRGVLAWDETAKTYSPTSWGLLLFMKEAGPLFFNRVLKATFVNQAGDRQIEDFNDALVLMPTQIEAWLRKVLFKNTSTETFERKDEYTYPIEVLREVILNALVHMDYEIKEAKCFLEIDEEKIVIKSPGAPVTPIKLEDFKRLKAPSLSRNPVLVAVLNDMGFVEGRGIGMRELKSLSHKHQLPNPVITWEDPYLVICLPRSDHFFAAILGEERYRQMDETDLKGWLFLKDAGPIGKSEYASHFKIDDKKAQRQLKKLVELGLAELSGKGPATKYKASEA